MTTGTTVCTVLIVNCSRSNFLTCGLFAKDVRRFWIRNKLLLSNDISVCDAKMVWTLCSSLESFPCKLCEPVIRTRNPAKIYSFLNSINPILPSVKFFQYDNKSVSCELRTTFFLPMTNYLDQIGCQTWTTTPMMKRRILRTRKLVDWKLICNVTLMIKTSELFTNPDVSRWR